MYVEDKVVDIVPGFTPEEWSHGESVVDVEAYAIEFQKGDSHHLAGPYIHEDKHYGLVVVTRHDEQRTLEEILRDTKEKHYSRPYSLGFIPHAARERIFKSSTLGCYCQQYVDPVTGFYFSDIDLKYGRNELNLEVVDRSVKSDNGYRIAPFWVTMAASLKISGMLTFTETSKMYADMNKVYEMVRKEMLIAAPTVDTPWKLYLCGNDDSSWTKVYATKEEVDEALELLRKEGFGYVFRCMQFTN